MTTDRPTLTIKEAARATGVSQRTIRRRVSEGAFPGAHKAGTDPLSPWLIPVEDLEAAGYSLYRSTAPAADHVEVVADTGAAAIRSVVANLEVDQLRRDLVEALHRAELAEVRAAAAERAAEIAVTYSERVAQAQLQRAESAERALHAITGGEPATPKRRWWRGGGTREGARGPDAPGAVT